MRSLLLQAHCFMTPSRPRKTVSLSIIPVAFSRASSSFRRSPQRRRSMRRELMPHEGRGALRKASIPCCGCTRPLPAPKHPGAALEALHGFPFLETSMFRMLREGAMHSRCDRVSAFANALNKTPPGGGPEGVRVPREVGVTDLPCAGDQSRWWPSSRSRGARTCAPKPTGFSAWCRAMCAKGFMAWRRSNEV